MTYSDILQHFGMGSLSEAARKLKRPVSTVANWRTRGIPMDTQFRIQVETRGRLKAG